MNMHVIDWAIVGALVTVLFVAALSTRRYSRTVAAFLAASRPGSPTRRDAWRRS